MSNLLNLVLKVAQGDNPVAKRGAATAAVAAAPAMAMATNKINWSSRFTASTKLAEATGVGLGWWVGEKERKRKREEEAIFC